MASSGRELELDQRIHLLRSSRRVGNKQPPATRATTLSLQLLQNCLMLINTILIQRTIDRQGLWARLQPEDFRALTPLFYGHINPYGAFELDLEGPSFLEAA